MNEKIIIRQEKKIDHPAVVKLVEIAFKAEKLSDHNEHLLVENLRGSTNFIPELSMVAELDEQIIG